MARTVIQARYWEGQKRSSALFNIHQNIGGTRSSHSSYLMCQALFKLLTIHCRQGKRHNLIDDISVYTIGEEI
jgi:hypothetical protein